MPKRVSWPFTQVVLNQSITGDGAQESTFYRVFQVILVHADCWVWHITLNLKALYSFDPLAQFWAHFLKQSPFELGILEFHRWWGCGPVKDKVSKRWLFEALTRSIVETIICRLGIVKHGKAWESALQWLKQDVTQVGAQALQAWKNWQRASESSQLANPKPHWQPEGCWNKILCNKFSRESKQAFQQLREASRQEREGLLQHSMQWEKTLKRAHPLGQKKWDV